MCHYLHLLLEQGTVFQRWPCRLLKGPPPPHLPIYIFINDSVSLLLFTVFTLKNEPYYETVATLLSCVAFE